MKDQEKLNLFEVGRRVREVREAKGLSGEELGARINRSQNAISKIELGQTAKVNLDNIRLIAVECDTTEDYLLLRSPYKTHQEEVRALIGQMRNNDAMWTAFLKHIALYSGYEFDEADRNEISSVDVNAPYIVFKKFGSEEWLSMRETNTFINDIERYAEMRLKTIFERRVQNGKKEG